MDRTVRQTAADGRGMAMEESIGFSSREGGRRGEPPAGEYLTIQEFADLLRSLPVFDRRCALAVWHKGRPRM